MYRSSHLTRSNSGWLKTNKTIYKIMQNKTIEQAFLNYYIKYIFDLFWSLSLIYKFTGYLLKRQKGHNSLLIFTPHCDICNSMQPRIWREPQSISLSLNENTAFVQRTWDDRAVPLVFRSYWQLSCLYIAGCKIMSLSQKAINTQTCLQRSRLSFGKG